MYIFHVFPIKWWTESSSQSVWLGVFISQEITADTSYSGHVQSCNGAGTGPQRGGIHKQASLACNPAGNFPLLTVEGPPWGWQRRWKPSRWNGLVSWIWAGSVLMKCSGFHKSLQLLQNLASYNKGEDQNIKLSLTLFLSGPACFLDLKRSRGSKAMPNMMLLELLSFRNSHCPSHRCQNSGTFESLNHLLTFGQNMAAAVRNTRHSVVSWKCSSLPAAKVGVERDQINCNKTSHVYIYISVQKGIE